MSWSYLDGSLFGERSHETNMHGRSNPWEVDKVNPFLVMIIIFILSVQGNLGKMVRINPFLEALDLRNAVAVRSTL